MSLKSQNNPDGERAKEGRSEEAPRTRWHRHQTGQFLYAISGRGRVRTRGQAGHLLEPGDVIHVDPDEWHFHGGSRGAPW